MNPQYQPQPQFGDPSQQPQQQQPFPSGRPNSNLNQSGGQDSFNMNNNPGPQPISNYMPPQSFGYKGPPRQQMPPPQMMSGQMQNGLTANQMPPQQPQGMMGQMPPSGMGDLNGPPPYLAVCPPHPSGLNQNQLPSSTSNQMGHPPIPNLMGPSSTSNQSSLSSGLVGPPSNQMGPPPTSNPMGPPPTNQMGPPPTNQMGPPLTSNQMGPPPTSNQMGPPSTSNQMGPPPNPNLMGPSSISNQMGPPPTSMNSGPMGPPPTSLSSGPMGSSQTQMNSGPMGPPPTSLGSSHMGPPPTSLGSGQIGSSQSLQNSGPMGPPPISQGSGHMGPPPTSLGSGPMGPPQTSLNAGPMGPPPTSLSSGPMGSQNIQNSGHMGPPPTSLGSGPMGPPPTSLNAGPMGPPPTSLGSGHMGPPPTSLNAGPMGPPPGQQPNQRPPMPSQLNSSHMPQMPPGPPGPPGPNQINPNPMGPAPPRPGQMQPNIPPTNMQSKSPYMPPPTTAGPPPFGGQNPPPLGGTHPPPLPPGRTTMPGMPQYPNKAYPGNPNQLTNQMNTMNLNAGGNRQYPPGPIKPALNGDNSMNAPHMPPQQMGQQYVNGSQNRMPYPPIPGQQPPQQLPSGPYPPQYQQQGQYQQAQPARRLDPDQMPSPIQVTLDDQKTRSGIFCTNQKGLVPPLVSTNFITQDQGNAGPRFIRSTMYNVPTTSDMMKQTGVPFGLVISPLARTIDQEYPPPIVDFGELGPVRCIRCKAYMCPFMQFIDSGRRFQCLFCKATTEVPAEYFQHLDHTGQRVDRYERPELILGSYEFVATKDYCRNNVYPKPPAVIFVIDVSYNNMKSGLVHLLCSEMKEILKHLPIDQGQEKSKMKVGFITYNSSVHFYNIKGTLAQPQMMVVGDTQEMFVPLLDGFLCDIEDSAAVIDSLMSQIPTMFTETRDTEIVLLPAIQAGLEALKASECAGKLLVFHSTLPTADAPGRLKNRDERKLLGTEKERTVLTPQTQAYNQLGQECVTAGCSVDLFITNNSYIDLATIGQISRLTGGEVFKYTYFQADVDGQRLINDIITDISRPVAFDSIMRVRTSTGIRPTDFYGHFFMSNTTDMEIPAIDCDKAVAIEIKHDDKLTEEEGVYIQVALLYTSCSGQRRLRVLNLSLKTCSQMADLYRSCELDTIVNFFSKQCVYKILENNPKAVKDSLVNRCAQMLACYRKNCASPSSAGQLILPECMKLLPLYVNCLMKSDAISGGSDMTLDDRSFVMQCVITMDIPTSLVYFYPRLIPLHEIQAGVVEDPDISAIRCTVEKMVDHGVYLLENGIHMLMWIGLGANQEWIQNVFGVSSAAQVDIDRITLPELDTSLSLTVRNLVDKIRAQRHRWMRLTLVRQHDKLETVFRHFLMEDRGQDGSTSYVDFLCHMHKEIRQLLS